MEIVMFHAISKFQIAISNWHYTSYRVIVFHKNKQTIFLKKPRYAKVIFLFYTNSRWATVFLMAQLYIEINNRV